MIKLYEEQKMSLNKIQKELGLAHYTLYRYANREVPIDRMETGTFLRMSNLLKEKPQDLFAKIKMYLEK